MTTNRKYELPIKIDLPNGFLCEEVRCGYNISEEMKKIWAVEIDLLTQFDKVCRKNGLKYFASCGTALGAVRHRGFIPWDDDVDVMMLRSEYDKLCEIAHNSFTYPYFFQTEETDPGIARFHAQLRNSETTAILRNNEFGYHTFNEGIFLDIFPLDNVTDEMCIFENQKHLDKKIRRKLTMYLNRFHPSNPTTKEKLVVLRNGILQAINKNGYKKYYNSFDSLCRQYNEQETNYVAMLCLGFENRAFRLRTDFDESVEMDFEFIKVPVPKNYDEALSRVYGDWRKIIMGSNDHGEVIFSATIPYTEYIKRSRK